MFEIRYNHDMYGRVCLSLYASIRRTLQLVS